MILTIKVNLLPDDHSKCLLLKYSKTFKKEIFKICAVFKKKHATFEYRYRNISNDISWNSKSIVLAKAKEMYKINVAGKLMKMNFSSIWNANSVYVDRHDHSLKLFLGRNQMETTIAVPIYWNKYVESRLCAGKMLSLSLYQTNDKWKAYIHMDFTSPKNGYSKSMGIDIGIKVPAVVCTEDMKIKFFGNGRMLRFYQRNYRSKYKALQASQNYSQMTKMNHKLHHILNDMDHKIAKDIINFAINQQIGTIKLEKLKYINRNFDIEILSDIYLWSYRRLQDMIIYKSNLHGINIEFVDPKNTSKECPHCNTLNYPKDRQYKCSKCNYQNHRDVIGAMNIVRALRLSD